jgi:hypothetical protein
VIFAEPRDGPVVEHLAFVVAPAEVAHAADLLAAHVAHQHAREQLCRVGPAHLVFEQRRDVDEARGLADGVVLALVG